MQLARDVLAAGSGSLVGFTLGLVGGGGSILAVPLLVYVVGVASPHVAIGTSAIAVAASAAANLLGHAKARTVKWSCALVSRSPASPAPRSARTSASWSKAAGCSPRSAC
jgi:uncharacterized membrane protein YfcA